MHAELHINTHRTLGLCMQFLKTRHFLRESECTLKIWHSPRLQSLRSHALNEEKLLCN